MLPFARAGSQATHKKKHGLCPHVLNEEGGVCIRCECFYSGLTVVLALHTGAAAERAHPPSVSTGDSNCSVTFRLWRSRKELSYCQLGGIEKEKVIFSLVFYQY